MKCKWSSKINNELIKYNLKKKVELKEAGVNNDSLLLKYYEDMCLNSFDLQRK